jgi:hypothetical protein
MFWDAIAIPWGLSFEIIFLQPGISSPSDLAAQICKAPLVSWKIMADEAARTPVFYQDQLWLSPNGGAIF